MQVLYFQTILAWGSFGWILEGSERYWKYGFFAGLFVFLLIVPLITWHYSLVVFLRDRLQRKGLGSIFVALMSAVLFSLCDHWLNFLNVSFGSYLYNRPELLP